MVAMYLSVGSWSKRGQGSQLTPIFLESMVRGINQALLDADQRVESISRMTGTGYQSLYHKTSELCQDLATLNSYVTGLPADLDTQLDHPLFERFANGPTGALADIKMDDITTDNLPGLQTQRTIQGDTITFTADQISFDDIIGVGDTTDGIPHFKDFFNQARIAWAAHQGPDGHDMSLDDYINALLTSGEYDHKGHHPVQDFITGLLDFTIVWALYKSMTGYDPITGETLSEIERLLGLGMALVDAIALAIAIPSGMGSLAGAAALKAALHIGARELIINALATGFAMATFELVTALGLPDWVAALAGLGAGILITTIGTTIIIKWGNRTYHFDTNGNQIPNHETSGTPDPGTSQAQSAGDTTPTPQLSSEDRSASPPTIGPVRPVNSSHQSGGTDSFLDDWVDPEVEAQLYEMIRADDQDVAAIADTMSRFPLPDGTVLSNSDINDIKNHLFFEKHPLTDYNNPGQVITQQYDPDINIAEAWTRLRSGNPTDLDIILLRHEYAEMRYYQSHPGSTYAEAHEAANEVANWWRERMKEGI